LDAAVAAGFHTFGVTEHAPRVEDRFLYDEERELGWDATKLQDDFECYAADSRPLVEQFADRLVVLRGFEAEVVPADRYVQLMQKYRARHGFEFMVGSVHYVEEIQIDGTRENYDRGIETFGGIEGWAVRYYETVAEMVAALKPEVVGHLDLVRKLAPSEESVDSPKVREAAFAALDVIHEHEGILDLNTAGYRKNLGRPYVAPWLLARVKELGVGVCFGDDSHGPEDVGAGLDDARRYLLENGIDSVRVLTRDGGAVVRRDVALMS
jgi:histidinol-phosphatase (PHP family)